MPHNREPVDLLRRYRNSRPVRFAEHLLSKPLAKFLSGKLIRRGPLAGLVMVLDTVNDPRWAGRRFGYQEPAVWRALGNLLRPGDVAYDVGAHIGTFVLYMARLIGPSGKVIGYEPDASNYLILQQNVRRNQLERYVHVRHCAIGAQIGKGTLAKEGLSACSHVVVGHSGGDTEISTLDHEVYAAGRPAPQLVLIDTEGAEVDVLRGSARLLAEARPTLIVEHHASGDKAGVIQTLSSIGYSNEDIDHNHTLHRAV